MAVIGKWQQKKIINLHSFASSKSDHMLKFVCIYVFLDPFDGKIRRWIFDDFTQDIIQDTFFLVSLGRICFYRFTCVY
jgi:hypothetical protein